jgi:hypothetical protein
MTIIEALEEVNDGLTPAPTFIFADLNEANFSVDAIANADLPVLIVLPFTPVDAIGKSGALKTTFELQAFMLTKKSDQVTKDFSAAEIEIEIVAPMRLLARKFIHNLNGHAIIDPETQGITSVSYQPIYSSMDAELHGVFIRATVPVMEKPLVCIQ